MESMYMSELVHSWEGISVADYVIVGANSVLVKSVTERGVIVAGVPAKILRKLTPEELKQLDWGKY